MPKVCPVCAKTYPDTSAFCPDDGTTLRAGDLDSELIGSVIADRYLITDLLGEGGMGKVYLARHVRLPLQAAIKVLRSELLRDSASVARFNREAANASRIDHERVARVFDFGETGDGLVYLAMEYIQGRTLKSLLAEEGPLPFPRVANIISQVADGLDSAHRSEIVHRDLKPDNILITIGENGEDRCKVVDFGIAKAVGGAEGERGLTKTGFVVGTPEYMSPEQLLGTAIDHRSDVYALALVAYQCLTGETPFDSNTPDRGMTARLISPPRTLHTVRPEKSWPDELQPVFDQALARDPKERTPSAGAFARALSDALLGIAATPVITAPIPRSPELSASHSAQSSAPAAAMSPGRTRGMSGASLAVFGGVGVAAVALIGFLVFQNGNPSTGKGSPAVDSSAVRNANPAPIASRPDTAPASTTPSTSGVPQTAAVPDTRTSGVGVRPPTSTAVPIPPAPTGAAQREAAPPSVDPRVAATNASPSAVAARKTLDSLTRVLDPTVADDKVATAAIVQLGGLLQRLGSADDSTWAFVRIAEANLLLGESKPACQALQSARRTARTMPQAEILTKYESQLRCTP